MKKGFTLIELLMVMVIASALVAVALPKYQRTLERSRALEGLTNARSAADYANSYYLTHNNTYPDEIPVDDLIKSRYFSVVTLNNGTITLSRNTQGWHYNIVATVEDGELTSLTCANTTSHNDCADLDLEGELLK